MATNSHARNHRFDRIGSAIGFPLKGAMKRGLRRENPASRLPRKWGIPRPLYKRFNQQGVTA